MPRVHTTRSRARSIEHDVRRTALATACCCHRGYPAVRRTRGDYRLLGGRLDTRMDSLQAVQSAYPDGTDVCRRLATATRRASRIHAGTRAGDEGARSVD